MKKYLLLAFLFVLGFIIACQPGADKASATTADADTLVIAPDTAAIPKDKYGEMVRYGRELFLHTGYYIGPNGVSGQYLRNKMNCTNCHQDAGTKRFSFNLMLSHARYPQYRAREGRVLSLAERVNNCVMRPHSGRPLPLDSKEMLAFLSYLKWIGADVKNTHAKGFENKEIEFPDRAADPNKGALVYNDRCMRCHGAAGEGKLNPAGSKDYYLYPPLWGDYAYQPGSSMHRIIKMARWLKSNMPHDSATSANPLLADHELLDVAAFVNDDRIHKRPSPATQDYPHPEEKAIDYGKGPFADPFTEEQHKFGPYKPIIDYLKGKGMKVAY